MFPTAAWPAQTAKLRLAFEPNRLGAKTTVVFGFSIAGNGTTGSSPLTSVRLSLPPTVGFFSSTLGEAICQPASLIERGLSGCSPNSRIGFGAARVRVPFGSSGLDETVHITAFAGNSGNGHVELLYYATGETPVIAHLLFQGEIGSSPLGEYMSTSIPPTPTLPGVTDASVISFYTTIGPSHLYYYGTSHGKRVRYHPRGIGLPDSCPRGGYPFSATFTFQDGSGASATDNVPCPTKTVHRAHHG
jgi:hypothetical protein